MKIGGRAYKNGVALYGKHYSVKAFYNDGELVYQVGKNALANNKLYQSARKIPVLRGMISLLISLYFFFKEAASKPKRFWPILLLISFNIVLEAYFILFPASSTKLVNNIFFLNPFIYWGLLLGGLFLLRQTLLAEIFKFHGAEHKAVNYYQANFSKSIAKHSRLARRCGTNLVAVYLIMTVLIEYLGLGFNLYWQTLLLLGVAYEILLLLPDSLLAIPFILQRFTTIEPETKHLRASKTALDILITQEENEVIK
ncbi:putative metal-dependent enzyme [Halobacteroides halobius DSM 5150]|uniref:Putative metal-dependent enzyme n=1 Tax=Halobacteroides halobius (strain ATCC 35273 / DSM 5150 / MD-1) TaxID=748449 RepID=L0K7T1_HALHC|nr:DUF1385 domain-containing protein [Halobacteroides halobius]AGB41312.1 putative metal-dependent enzyme [Halobacteroides halobius DSM 5150]